MKLLLKVITKIQLQYFFIQPDENHITTEQKLLCINPGYVYIICNIFFKSQQKNNNLQMNCKWVYCLPLQQDT